MERSKNSALVFIKTVLLFATSLTLLFSTGMGVWYTFVMMGEAWGFLSIGFFAVLLGYIYFINLYHAKTIKEVIDGSLASILQFFLVTVIMGVITVVSEGIRQTFNSSTIGWSAFVVFAIMAGMFYVRTNNLHYEQ